MKMVMTVLIKRWSLIALLAYVNICMVYGGDELEDMTVGGGAMDDDLEEDLSKFYPFNEPVPSKPMRSTAPLMDERSPMMSSPSYWNRPPTSNPVLENKGIGSMGGMMRETIPVVPDLNPLFGKPAFNTNNTMMPQRFDNTAHLSNSFAYPTQNAMPDQAIYTRSRNENMTVPMTASRPGAEQYPFKSTSNSFSMTPQTTHSANFSSSTPRGQNQEEAGYIVPRFPTKYQVLPAFNPPPQCTVNVTVSDLTDGKVQSLKGGGLQIFYNMYQQKLKFYTFGKPRYSTRNLLKFPYWVYKKVFTRVQEFTSMDLVPSGCVVHPQDKNIMHTVETSGKYTVGGTLNLSAEEYALYTPVDIPPPVDIAAPENVQYGKQDFRMIGPCVMSGHFPVAPHQIVVSSSITNASIIIQTPQGTEVLQATYPEVCLPLFFNRIAVWVLPITDGATVLIATSPPIVVGDRQEQWKLVPHVTQEAFKDHAYVSSS